MAVFFRLMAQKLDEKADGRLQKTSLDALFIVRSTLESNGLQIVKNVKDGKPEKPRATLAQPAPESTADRLAQKPTSGRASSPAGSPKSATVAAPSAGTVAVNDLEAAYLAARRNFDSAEDAAHMAAELAAHTAAELIVARAEFQKAWAAFANS